MPYNNTPITPSKEITGTVALPLARVKKIIATDDDISNCSNNASFVITVAAEMFLQHLVEQSYNIVKSERKPRRNIQYRDVANAVSRVENLEFLTDVVPKTTTYRQHKQKQRQAPQQPDEEGNEAATTNLDSPEVQIPAQPHGGMAQGHLSADGRLVMPERAARPPTREGLLDREAGRDGMEAIEAQATNGASHTDYVGEEMEVDGDDEESMHTAHDGRTESVSVDEHEREREGMDVEGS